MIQLQRTTQGKVGITWLHDKDTKSPTHYRVHENARRRDSYLIAAAALPSNNNTSFLQNSTIRSCRHHSNLLSLLLLVAVSVPSVLTAVAFRCIGWSARYRLRAKASYLCCKFEVYVRHTQTQCLALCKLTIHRFVSAKPCPATVFVQNISKPSVRMCSLTNGTWPPRCPKVQQLSRHHGIPPGR